MTKNGKSPTKPLVITASPIAKPEKIQVILLSLDLALQYKYKAKVIKKVMLEVLSIVIIFVCSYILILRNFKLSLYVLLVL